MLGLDLDFNATVSACPSRLLWQWQVTDKAQGRAGMIGMPPSWCVPSAAALVDKQSQTRMDVFKYAQMVPK